MSGGRLALLADCLLLGLLVAICAIPVVTAYPALVTACTLLRDDGRIGEFGPRLGQVLRSGLSVWLVPPLAALLLALDAVAVMVGVPGSGPLTVLLIAAGLAGGVLALRCAIRWHAGKAWSRIVREAARELTRDAPGSLLLGFAIVAAVAIAVLVPLTGLVLGGMLALAAVAVSKRTPATADNGPAAAHPAAASPAYAHPAVDPHPVCIPNPQEKRFPWDVDQWPHDAAAPRDAAAPGDAATRDAAGACARESARSSPGGTRRP